MSTKFHHDRATMSKPALHRSVELPYYERRLGASGRSMGVRGNGTSSHQTPTKKVGSGREIFFRSTDFRGVVEVHAASTASQSTTVGVWVDRSSTGEMGSAKQILGATGLRSCCNGDWWRRSPSKRFLCALLLIVSKRAVVLFRDSSWSMYRVNAAFHTKDRLEVLPDFIAIKINHTLRKEPVRVALRPPGR